MATKGKTKCKETTLEELVEEAQALLEEKPAKRKKGETVFDFHRNPLTGLRESKHKYRPCFASKASKSNSNDNSAACSSVEGDLTIKIVLL